MSDHAVDIDHHVQIYIRVFVALMVATVITVAVAYIHFTTALAVAVALLIASIKASLVACYFMHLISEKKLIFLIMGFTVFFFVATLLLPALTDMDRIEIAES